MKDYYLKFTSQTQAESVLYTTTTETFTDTETETVTNTILQPLFQNISTIGTIYTPGTYDTEGNTILEPTPLPGYHVNVRALPNEDTAPIESYNVQVNSPVRVWA